MTMLLASYYLNDLSLKIISGTAADTMPPVYYFLLTLLGE